MKPHKRKEREYTDITFVYELYIIQTSKKYRSQDVGLKFARLSLISNFRGGSDSSPSAIRPKMQNSKD